MDILKYLDKGIYAFFMFFFMLYIGKFGITGLILEPINTWNVLFNLGVWFVLVMFCMDGLFKRNKFVSKGEKE